MGVAEGGRAGAAAFGAAVVAGGQGSALGVGDGVAERFEAADLAEGGQEHSGEAGVAQQGFDPGPGLWSGPGAEGAPVLGRLAPTRSAKVPAGVVPAAQPAGIT